MDQANAAHSRKAVIKRVEAKANAKMYKNESWDLVDKMAANGSDFDKIDRETLPDSLQHKTSAELKQLVNDKSRERAAIQARIVALNQQRQQYIDDQKQNREGQSTLETEIERIIKEQVNQFKMSIK